MIGVQGLRFCLYTLKKTDGIYDFRVRSIEKYIYGALREQLSSAFMGSFLMKRGKKQKSFLEETIDTLQKKSCSCF
jgi:hypothetical protein